MAKKEKKTEKTKKTAEKGLAVKDFKVSNRALKELVKFFKSVDTPQKLADFFNQGKDLKKASKVFYPTYNTDKKYFLLRAMGWPDVGPNDPCPYREILDIFGADMVEAVVTKKYAEFVFGRVGMRFGVTAFNGSAITPEHIRKNIKQDAFSLIASNSVLKTPAKKSEKKAVEKTAKTTAKTTSKASAKKSAKKAAK